jgi:hypothetical protein
MLKNKRIENPKSHYKLEFDIKTNDNKILKLLERIQDIVSDEFINVADKLEAEVTIELKILDKEEVK